MSGVQGIQPTKTQGSIIRRMDQGGYVDPTTVVKSDEKPDLEAELPARGTSKSLKQKFQSMETTEIHVTVDFSKPVKQERPKSAVYGDVPAQLVEINGEVHNEPEFEGGEIENQPIVREDVVRESDRNDEQELPETGYARSLLSKFKELEKEAETIKQTLHKPSGVGSKQSVTPMRPTSIVLADDYESPHVTEGGEYENNPVVRTDVVRERDSVNLEEELPSQGLARSLVSAFRQKEEEAKKASVYKPSGTASREDSTDQWNAPIKPATSVQVYANQNAPPQTAEGGEYENSPVVRTDVVREHDSVAEELPSQGITRNLLSAFRQKEEEAKKVPVYKPSGVAYRGDSTDAAKVHSRTSSISSNEVHSEPQFEGGVCENVPAVRSDVIRETDRNDQDELPEQGLARNIRAHFQGLQIPKSDYVAHKPSGIAGKATPTPLAKANPKTPVVSYHDPISGDTTDSVPDIKVDGGEYENNPVIRTDVVREGDHTDELELPESGLARNLLQQFKSLEMQHSPSYTPSGIGSKATPSKLHIMAGRSSYYKVGDSGEADGAPVSREEVVNEKVRSDADELPEQGLARNLLSRYTSIEEQNRTAPAYKPSGVANKPVPTPIRPASTVLPSTNGSANGSSGHDDSNSMEDESQPDENIVRSYDPNINEIVPSAGAAKNMMEKFKQLESRKSDQTEHRPSKVASMSTPTPLSLKR